MPLPELSPRPTLSSISSPVRKSNAQAPLAGQVPFEQVKQLSKSGTQARTQTTESLLTTPVSKDKHKTLKKASVKDSVSIKKTAVQSSVVTEKKIPAKTTSASKVTKAAAKTKAKPATATSKAKSAAAKKKVKSPEVVTASDDDEAGKQSTKNTTATTPSTVASGSKPKTTGSKTSRTLVPASKFDLFNLDSSLVNDSDSDSDIYDSVANPIKPIPQSPTKKSANASSKTPTQPTLVEGLKQIKPSTAAKAVNVTGSAKDLKQTEVANGSKTKESSELAKKPQSVEVVKKDVLSEISKRPETPKDLTESEPKKTASVKAAKKAVDTKVTNSVSVKESQIETAKAAKPIEPVKPVKPVKEVTKVDLKKANPPKEATKPVPEPKKPEAYKKPEPKKPEAYKKPEPKKPEAYKKPEPIAKAESVKKPEPAKEVKTLESKPAGQAVTIEKASSASLNGSQKAKPVLDSSDSESESDDDDGSDIPSSPEPTKRLVAVNTPSVTKSTSSQTPSRVSSFIDVLDRKPLTDDPAVPITNSVLPTGSTSATQVVEPVEKPKSQPPKRIAGIQSLSALAKRAIPEVHDSTSSKLQSQKTKAVINKPVVEVSSDESSSDDDSDDDDSDDDDSDDDSSDDDSDDDEPKAKIGGRADKRKKKSKNRGFMKMIKAAKRT
ncbi:hypothetical protein DV453_004611 [Geotrichum candidum]|nr:hypothetical protein DV453_004611 [Geotrichum candidum]